MISALELKNKLESFDKNTPLLNYNVLFGFLPAIILFPLYLILSTNRTESAIIHSPFMFGVGLFGFFIMCLVFSTGSLMITYLALGRYIAAKDAIRRFNVNGILQDELIFRKMANGIWEYIKLHRKHDALYQADLEAIRTEVRKEIDEVKTDYMRQFRIQGLALTKEHNLRLQAERDRDSAKQLNKKLTRLIISLSKIITTLKKEIKRLKGE